MELLANLTKAMDPRPQKNAQGSSNVRMWPQKLLASLGLFVGHQQVPRLPDGKCLPQEQEYDSSGLILAMYLEKERPSVNGDHSRQTQSEEIHYFLRSSGSL